MNSSALRIRLWDALAIQSASGSESVSRPESVTSAKWSADVAEALAPASSQGQYFNQVIGAHFSFSGLWASARREPLAA